MAKINQCMRLPTNYNTFHAFRRSGASLAYDLDIPVKEIKVHGTWSSDCVWRYIRSSASAEDQVSHTFRKVLSGPTVGLGFGEFYDIILWICKKSFSLKLFQLPALVIISNF